MLRGIVSQEEVGSPEAAARIKEVMARRMATAGAEVATRKRGGTVSAIEGGASIKQEKRTVAVRRGENGLGIDVSDP